jgi:N-acyl-D-amino-acid deacylase
VGIDDRGVLAVGKVADITVFDPARIIDKATFEAPHQYSVGVVHVLVSGKPVLESGQPTGARPGQILRGKGFNPAFSPRAGRARAARP